MVDPWGRILAECDQDDASVPQCRTVKIALDPLLDVRKRLPCFEHRRNDVYALAPLRLISAEKSINVTNSESKPVPIEDEKTPYFLFEKYPVPKATTFLETPLSIAFTNITCVVPGRRFSCISVSFFFDLPKYSYTGMFHTPTQMFWLQLGDVLVDWRTWHRRKLLTFSWPFANVNACSRNTTKQRHPRWLYKMVNLLDKLFGWGI